MNPRDGSTPTASPGPDDERIAGLIRTVADDWKMPPHRLGDSTWRDRTGRRTSHRPGRAERVLGPLAAALVASVVLAVAAVFLTAPREDRGVASGPSATAPSGSGQGSRPPASAVPSATPLPPLLRNGDLPSVTSVLVRSDGRLHVADLATGTLGPSVFGPHSGGTTVVARPGGGWLCICVDWTEMRSDGPAGLRAVLQPVDADGTAEQAREIRTLTGVPDPAQSLGSGSPLVDAGTSISDDGRFAFLGWSVRDGADWKAGLDIVDIASGAVAATAPLPVVTPDVKTDRPIIRVAPAATLSPDGSTILASSFWYVDDPTTGAPPSGTDHWTSSFDGTKVGRLSAAGSTFAGPCGEFDQGLVDDDLYYVLCYNASGQILFKRIARDGTAAGDPVMLENSGGTDGGNLTVRVGDSLFVWGPITRTLGRIDLKTGTIETAVAPTATVEDEGFGGLAGLGRDLGRWLAPSAAAKTFLDPGIVASPDGKQIYAIGVTGSSDPRQEVRPASMSFDASTLDVLGHWQPTADFTSIAVSADGRSVYAAAPGGVDAAGLSAPNGASITVFDTTDGSVDLIAGKLGSSDLFLTDRTVR